VLAARLMVRRGDLRKAAKILETTWRTGPHPDLAKTYLNLRTGDSVRDRMARAETLAKISSWNPEARLALAQAAFEARAFAQAREALAPLLADRPTVRACLAMARIEEAEHGASSGRAREWLSRAAHAPRDPLWIADGVASETWAPVSPVSGRLDAFVWKTPTELLAGPEDSDANEPTQADTSLPTPTPPSVTPVTSHKPDVPKAEAAKPDASKSTTVLFPSESKGGTEPIAAAMAQATLGPLAAGTPTPVVFPPPRTGEDVMPRRAG
jgi:HemY protein